MVVVIRRNSISIADAKPLAVRVGGHIGTGSTGAVVASDDYGANRTPFPRGD